MMLQASLVLVAGAVLGSMVGAPSAYSQDTVAVPADDGGLVTADEYGSGPRGVVLAHGGRFDRKSWRDQARVLAREGYRVLAIDFRAGAMARAGGPPDCLYDPKCLAADVLAAVRYLRRTGATSVAIIGGSLGGGAAAQASVEAAPDEIDVLVLLAPMAIEHPEQMKGRKLFIVSREDRGSGDRLRLPGIEEQYRRSPDPKELLLVEGSAHAQFLFTTDQGERLMEAILGFLVPRRSP